MSVIRIMTLLPHRAALWLSTLAALAARRLVPRLEVIGRRNTEIAFPERTTREHDEMLDGAFRNIGRVLGSLSQFPKFSRQMVDEIVDFRLDETSEKVYEMNRQGRGVLIATAHLGNWELLAFAFSVKYEPLSYLVRPLDNPRLEAALARYRSSFGNRPISKRNATREAIRQLRDGGILGMLLDINSNKKEGAFVPFFDTPACTSVGAATIALRSDAIIFPVCCVWDENAGKYLFIHGDPIEPAKTGDMKHDVVATTTRITAEIEKMIRRYPDQWLWIHRRWKTRPDGEPDIY